MDFLSAVVTLFLIMDPLGNVPIFLSVLKQVSPERRRKILVREVLIAYAVLLFFLLVGDRVLELLQIQQETISIAGGIVLFLIAVRMIFPQTGGTFAEASEGEPLVVPLAIPLIAGPSTLATLLLLRADTDSMFQLWLATTVAWCATAAILIAAPFFYRALGERGLVAMERLMGMVLVMISVQMFLNGVATFLAR